MSKVNPKATVSDKFDTTERLAGGMGMHAAKQDNIGLLRRAVLANLLWEDIAYMDGVSVSDEIKRLIPLCSASDVAELTVEARTKQKLRHIPLFLAVHMLKHPEHKKLVEDILPKIITRADMITDFVALYATENGGKIKPMAKAAQRGLAKAFDNFDEYQFAKYDRDGGVKLRDVLFLVHAKPVQGKEELYKKIADRKLTVPDTWEVSLSTGKDKKDTWVRLINESKLGGLAMLRNISNMMKASVDKKVIEKGLLNLKGFMLMPLDYLKAAKMNEEFSRAIEQAMLNSYANLPKLSGKTLFIVDKSGSMGAMMALKSQFSRMDAAFAMAMLAANQCEDYSLVVTAGDDGTSKHQSALIKYPAKGFDILKQLRDANVGGGGIFTRQVLEWSKENVGKDFDRIIIFSDSQDCDKFDKIPKPFGKYNYICDVSAHKRGVNFKGVWSAEISGFSEHFITYIAAMEGLTNSFQDQE